MQPRKSKDLSGKNIAYLCSRTCLESWRRRGKRSHKLDIRYTLAFPAMLHFKWKGKNVSCNTVEAAEKVSNEQ